MPVIPQTIISTNSPLPPKGRTINSPNKKVLFWTPHFLLRERERDGVYEIGWWWLFSFGMHIGIDFRVQKYGPRVIDLHESLRAGVSEDRRRHRRRLPARLQAILPPSSWQFTPWLVRVIILYLRF